MGLARSFAEITCDHPNCAGVHMVLMASPGSDMVFIPRPQLEIIVDILGAGWTGGPDAEFYCPKHAGKDHDIPDAPPVAIVAGSSPSRCRTDRPRRRRS